MINLKNKNILVVEDDEVNFIFVSQVLKLTGCNIKWIKTGLDAIEYIRAENLPDLVLLDIQLPDMNVEKLLQHKGVRIQGPYYCANRIAYRERHGQVNSLRI
jgi:CheY-like chemotaxis protein